MSSTTRFSGNADRIYIEGEENGWELVVDTEEAAFRFNVHGMASSRELSDNLLVILKTLADWRIEGEQAAQEWQIQLDKKTDESGGYDDDLPIDRRHPDYADDPFDPKSPRYHDRMVGDA